MSEPDIFFQYFNEVLENISELSKDSKHTKLYQKILYVSILDSLSKCVYPRRKPRERMVFFIKEFSGWENVERVSLPHLIQLLKLNPEPAFKGIREYAINEFNNWSVHSGQLMSISKDPKFYELKSKWPKENELRTPIEKISLDSLQHAQLFYTYRNSLVHEFRSPGYGIELTEDHQSPFYHIMSEINDFEELVPKSVELVYPVKFFSQLCTKCIENLKEYIKINNLNPYDYYDFGTYWLKELNINA